MRPIRIEHWEKRPNEDVYSARVNVGKDIATGLHIYGQLTENGPWASGEGRSPEAALEALYKNVGRAYLTRTEGEEAAPTSAPDASVVHRHRIVVATLFDLLKQLDVLGEDECRAITSPEDEQLLLARASAWIQNRGDEGLDLGGGYMLVGAPSMRRDRPETTKWMLAGVRLMLTEIVERVRRGCASQDLRTWAGQADALGDIVVAIRAQHSTTDPSDPTRREHARQVGDLLSVVRDGGRLFDEEPAVLFAAVALTFGMQVRLVVRSYSENGAFGHLVVMCRRPVEQEWRFVDPSCHAAAGVGKAVWAEVRSPVVSPP